MYKSIKIYLRKNNLKLESSLIITSCKMVLLMVRKFRMNGSLVILMYKYLFPTHTRTGI